MVYETFNDVRLVGASIILANMVVIRTTGCGKTYGDFALFRVYCGPDGKPAEYSEENIPYSPKHHFPISLDGVQTAISL